MSYCRMWLSIKNSELYFTEIGGLAVQKKIVLTMRTTGTNVDFS